MNHYSKINFVTHVVYRPRVSAAKLHIRDENLNITALLHNYFVYKIWWKPITLTFKKWQQCLK